MTDAPETSMRLEELERRMREIDERLQAVERLLVRRTGNPVDKSVVREKVRYDWQG
jgi:hypothetical protein